MSTIQEYHQLGPAVKCRFELDNGLFLVKPTTIGWNILRQDTFRHQVSWDTDPAWKTTYLENYQYKVGHFFTKENAELAVTLANKEYPSNLSLIPIHLGSLAEYLMDYHLRLPDLKKLVRLAKNKHYYQR